MNKQRSGLRISALTSAPPAADFLRNPKNPIQQHRNHAQHADRHNHMIQPEYLTSINDQIAKPLPCSDKFSDHNADQTEPDIDLHYTE